MKRPKLKLKKFKISKLTNSASIRGGSGDTTSTNTACDDSNTQAPTTHTYETTSGTATIDPPNNHTTIPNPTAPSP